MIKKTPRGASIAPDEFADLVTPDGRLLWTSPEMYDPVKGQPVYTTTQVGKFFFGRGTRWMYKHLLIEPKLDHPEIGTLDLLRTSRSRVPARRWRLYDVELFAHILAAHQSIQGVQLARTIRVIKLSAEMWGYSL